MKCLPEQHKELDAKLRQQGLCIVPIAATKSMTSAASHAMRNRKEAMGDEWFYVGNRVKAALRWTAMLEAWWKASQDDQDANLSTPKADPSAETQAGCTNDGDSAETANATVERVCHD